MNNILYETYVTVLPIVTTSILGYAVYVLKEQRKEKNALTKGVLCLLRKDLIHDHDEYMNRGSITFVELESFKAAHKTYKELGGNGVAEHLDEDLKKLPIEN